MNILRYFDISFIINKYILAYKNKMEGGNQEVLDARAKLAARFGKVQVGGKGRFGFKSKFQVLNLLLRCLVTWIILFDHILTVYYHIGSQRRTKKVVHHQEVNEDKKLKSVIKKFGRYQNIIFLIFLRFRYATTPRYWWSQHVQRRQHRYSLEKTSM